jgi:alkanesulfonate monooxygenase SsuD/methylene tetrahydromethanopterin reductase-like flavin-dependent oxidoreductase (luciferase family)
MRLAAAQADIWSGFATESSLPEWFVPMLKQLDEACADVGRDIGSLGRSIGVVVEPGTTLSAEATGFGVPISGSADEIADTLRRFEQIGVDRIEIIPWPGDEETLAAIEPAIRQLNS